MQFGANTFIWASPFSGKELHLINKVHELGFEVIEIACEEPVLIDLSAVETALDETGLSVIIYGVFGPDRDISSENKDIRENAKDYLRWCIDAAHALNAPLVCGPMYSCVGKTRLPTKEGRRIERQRSVEGLREIAAYACKHNIRLAIEPLNRYENDMINTTWQALALIKEIGSPYLGIHLNTFHMHVEEKSLAAAIRLAGNRLFHVHACENDRGVPGTGQVHWQKFSEALRKIDYQGAIVIESFAPNVRSITCSVSIWRTLAPDQDTIAREGLKFLRKILSPDVPGTELDPGLAVYMPC